MKYADGDGHGYQMNGFTLDLSYYGQEKTLSVGDTTFGVSRIGIPVWRLSRIPADQGAEDLLTKHKTKGEGTATFPMLVAPRGFEPRFDG